MNDKKIVALEQQVDVLRQMRDEAFKLANANKNGWDNASLVALRLERERDEARRERDAAIDQAKALQAELACCRANLFT